MLLRVFAIITKEEMCVYFFEFWTTERNKQSLVKSLGSKSFEIKFIVIHLVSTTLEIKHSGIHASVILF